MLGLTRRNVTKVSDEQRVDADGATYRSRKWVGGGHTIEINEDLYGYHARADDDPKTVKTNMDEGGIIGWLMSIFESERR